MPVVIAGFPYLLFEDSFLRRSIDTLPRYQPSNHDDSIIEDDTDSVSLRTNDSNYQSQNSRSSNAIEIGIDRDHLSAGTDDHDIEVDEISQSGGGVVYSKGLQENRATSLVSIQAIKEI